MKMAILYIVFVCFGFFAENQCFAFSQSVQKSLAQESLNPGFSTSQISCRNNKNTFKKNRISIKAVNAARTHKRNRKGVKPLLYSSICSSVISINFEFIETSKQLIAVNEDYIALSDGQRGPPSCFL